jgi:hypothetical protein
MAAILGCAPCGETILDRVPPSRHQKAGESHWRRHCSRRELADGAAKAPVPDRSAEGSRAKIENRRHPGMECEKKATLTRHLPRAEIIKDMIKGCFNAAVALVIASLLDSHFCDGRHTDAAFAILRQIRQSMGF